MKLTYHWEGDYLIPDLISPESPKIGIWGEHRRQFLRSHQRPVYRSTPKECRNCPYKFACGANEKGQKMMTTHIWQEYLDIVEHLRKTDKGKDLYSKRKETVERVFADAKEKHAMRYTHHRGLAHVTNWVRLKYAAMNLKKLANWSWNSSCFASILAFFFPIYENSRCFA